MWAMSPNLRIKLDKRLKSDLMREKEQISTEKKKTNVERRRESREGSSNFSLRSTELGCSVFVEPRTKVHLRDETYAWVPENLGFHLRFKQRVREIVGFRSPRLPKASSSLQEVEVLPTLVYFLF